MVFSAIFSAVTKAMNNLTFVRVFKCSNHVYTGVSDDTVVGSFG